MTEHQNTDPRIELLQLYKKYLLSKGEIPSSFQQLMEFGQIDLAGIKTHFRSMTELETALLLLYFKQSDDLVNADETSATLSSKERHLAFLYVLVEKAGDDEIFLQEFLRHKRKDPAFIKEFMAAINVQELEVLKGGGKIQEVFEKIKLNPKRTALINHALSVLYFFLNDRSAEKQDTDAFIEKTTDLLFKLTDTSTLSSLLDFGKFMASRQKTAFTWD